MNRSSSAPTQERVLIHAPFGRDSGMIADVLKRVDIDARICEGVNVLLSELQSGAGAILVADEALNSQNVRTLSEVLKEQPHWSDLPVLVMTSGGEATESSQYRLKLLDPLGNVTLLERPLRMATLVSAIRTALRARRRQYEIAVSIAERESLLAQLRHSEQLYRSIGESIDFGIWVCTAEGQNIYASPSFLKLVGLTQQEYSGLGWRSVLHPEEAERTMVAWRECVATRGFWNEVQRVRGVDGEWHPVLARGGPVRNDRGEIIFWAGINLDISREKRTEEALREVNEALRRSNADLEQFAYAASHDLQEPLRNVAIFSQLLKERYGGKLDSQADEFLAYTFEGAKRMEVLIKDLLTYTQATQSSDKPIAPVNAGEVLDKTLASLKVIIDEHNASITHDPLPPLLVHEAHLQQIFQNLIGNSIKYRNQEPPRLHIETVPEGSYWLFSVRDNGIGIDPKHSQQVFGIFKRLHSREKYPGTGIGLALCQKIVTRYRGRIWVESELGKGATFRFTLPGISRSD